MAKAKNTTKKQTAAKKRANKKAAKAIKKANTGIRHDRNKVMKETVRLRDEQNMGWEAIAAKVGCDPGLCRLMYMTAKVKPSEVIKGNPSTVAKAIIKARDEQLQSWGLIAARARLAESRVRRIYAEATGSSDQQGYRVVHERTKAKLAAQKAAKPKKAAAKRTTQAKKAA